MRHDGGGVMIQTTRRALELPNLNMMLKDLGWEQEEKSQLVLENLSWEENWVPEMSEGQGGGTEKEVEEVEQEEEEKEEKTEDEKKVEEEEEEENVCL